MQHQFVDEATRSDMGCNRTGWTGAFQAVIERTLGEAGLKCTSGTTEIKFTPGNSCGQDDYIHLNPGLGKRNGLRCLDVAGRGSSRI